MSRRKKQRARVRREEAPRGGRGARSGPRPQAARRPRSVAVSKWIPFAVIVGLVVIAYLPALRATYIWDDARYVTENPLLRSGEGLARIWFDVGSTIQYYPLVFTTFWIEYQFWKLAPLGYHLVNVLLHAASAGLLGLILVRLAVPGAWFVAALFALHPVQVESVAWITERKNVLSGLFYMGSLLAYLRFRPLDAANGDRRPRWGFYVLALVLFLAALLSKTVTCSLPAVLLLLLWWKRKRVTKSDVVPLVGMLILGAGLALVTIWMEKNNVGARGADWDLGVPDRVLVAGRAIWFYLAKLVVPIRLTFNYVRWDIDAGAAWQYLFPLAVVGLTMLLWWQRGRIGKAPLVAWLFFGGTLLPALGFIDVYPMRYSFVADHFQYLASIGPLALLGALLHRALATGKWSARGAAEELGSPRHLAIYAIVLVVLGGLTWRQAHVYADRETLWRDTLAKNPTSFLAHCNLGGILMDRGQVGEATRHLSEAVRLKPDMHEALTNLGRALAAQGRVEEALGSYDRALEVRPDLVQAHLGRGDVLAEAGRFDEAMASYEEALRRDPESSEVLNNLANALARRGRAGEAVPYYRRALAADPENALAHKNLANALAELGRVSEAIPHFREALRLRPDDPVARGNLALALASGGDVDGAIREHQEALRLDPADEVARYRLAELLAGQGKVDAAVRELRTTLQVAPGHGPARQLLDSLSTAAAE